MTAIAIIVTIILSTAWITEAIRKARKENEEDCMRMLGIGFVIYDTLSHQNAPKTKRRTKANKVAETDETGANSSKETATVGKTEEDASHAEEA